MPWTVTFGARLRPSSCRVIHARSAWTNCCESQTRAPERGSVSRSTLTPSRGGSSTCFVFYEAAAGRKPAPLWSAPAERSDDGALAQSRTAMEPTCSCAQPLQNQKRRGATLPAALQNACYNDLAECGSVSRSTRIATDALDLSKRWAAGKAAAGHRPALLWLQLRFAAPYRRIVFGRTSKRSYA